MDVVLRLMHSGRDFAWLYPRQDQVCFLDGHVRALAHLGGLPRRIAYDNLKAAVGKMLAGSERVLAPRFAALSSHYLFEASFARPRTGHDKGGVEARGKGLRWQELVPIPSGDSLDAISDGVLARLDARAAQAPIAERFVDESAALLPCHRRLTRQRSGPLPFRARRSSSLRVRTTQSGASGRAATSAPISASTASC
jgi:transposase